MIHTISWLEPGKESAINILCTEKCSFSLTKLESVLNLAKRAGQNMLYICCKYVIYMLFELKSLNHLALCNAFVLFILK